MGFRDRKIIILPNMLRPEEYLPKWGCQGKSIIYFGRLSVEKGLFTLLEAIKGHSLAAVSIVGLWGN